MKGREVKPHEFHSIYGKTTVMEHRQVSCQDFQAKSKSKDTFLESYLKSAITSPMFSKPEANSLEGWSPQRVVRRPQKGDTCLCTFVFVCVHV